MGPNPSPPSDREASMSENRTEVIAFLTERAAEAAKNANTHRQSIAGRYEKEAAMFTAAAELLRDSRLTPAGTTPGVLYPTAPKVQNDAPAVETTITEGRPNAKKLTPTRRRRA